MMLHCHLHNGAFSTGICSVSFTYLSLHFLGQKITYFPTTFYLLNFHLLSSDDCTVLHPYSSQILQEIFPERSFSRELWCENLIRSFYIQDWFQRERGMEEGEMVLLFCSGHTHKNSVLGSKGKHVKEKKSQFLMLSFQ
jgi:hypothetical protein